jgi:hypothetical protein
MRPVAEVMVEASSTRLLMRLPAVATNEKDGLSPAT